jgi:ABC-type polysaccharide/polyol phosphate export permease
MRATTIRDTMAVPTDHPQAPPPTTQVVTAAALSTGPRREIWFKRRIGLVYAARELWLFRGLIRSLAERDLRIRYKQAVLGIAWAVFTPIVLMLAFTLVFTKFGHVQTAGIPYPLFSYVGLIPWTFFSSSVLAGGMSLVSNTPLLNKLYCPREVFPLGGIAVAAADGLVSTLVLLALFPIEHFVPTRQAIYMPIMLLTLLAFTFGVTLATAALLVYLRDLRLALPLMIQLGLFVTPVAYGVAAIAKSRAGVLLYSALNPLVPVIAGLRQTLLLGQDPDWTSQLVGGASSLVFLVGGFLLFKYLETGLADVA